MIWALVLVAVAIVGVFAVMGRTQAKREPLERQPDDDDEPDTPPITDAPVVTPRPKQILSPTHGSQPLAKVEPAKVEPAKEPQVEPPVEPTPAAPVLARTKSATLPPAVRTKAPTIPPPQQVAAESGLSMRSKRPSSSPPLSEGGVVVRMKPPTNPPPLTGSEKKGTPGQGVVIRGKPPTVPPLERRGTPGTGVSTGRSKTPGSVPILAGPEIPEVVPPAALANKLRFATLSATISHVGIDAKREDGMARKVMWPDVVGIVARRLPPDEPYAGATFIDIVSTAGATLRILPWTHLAGDRIDGEGSERARAFVQLAAARCPGAKLDAATRTFLGSHGPAAQLPDEPTLAAHDKRLS